MGTGRGGWWVCLPGFQGTGLASDGVESFPQRCGLRYGDKERNANSIYAVQVWVGWGQGESYLGLGVLAWSLVGEEALSRVWARIC